MKPNLLTATFLTPPPPPIEKLRKERLERQRTIDETPALLADCKARLHALKRASGTWEQCEVILSEVRGHEYRFDQAKTRIEEVLDPQIAAHNKAARDAKLAPLVKEVLARAAAHSKDAHASVASASAYMQSRQVLAAEFPELAADIAGLPGPSPLALDMGEMARGNVTAPPSLLDFSPTVHRVLAAMTKKAG